MSAFDSISVLVVDDEADFRGMLIELLKAMGFERIIAADNGASAIEKITEYSVDLVICDWYMPQMKGIEVLRFVRNHPYLHNLPFIMVSGMVPEAVIAEAAETEVDAYLLKPFTAKQLRAKISQILQRRQNLSEFERHLASGRTHRRTWNFDKAIEEFRRALALNPQSPRIHLEMGKCQEERGDHQEAARHFEAALAISPKYMKGHESLVGLYKKQGDNGKMLFHLEQMTRINPRNVERNLELGKTLMACGRSEEARAILEQTLGYASEQYTEVAERVATAFIEMGAEDLAEQTYSRALQTNPHNVGLCNRLGILYRQRKEYVKAIANYLRGLEATPDNPTLLHNLAIAYYEAGRRAEAVEALERALAIRPTFPEAQALLALYRP